MEDGCTADHLSVVSGPQLSAARHSFVSIMVTTL